MNERIKELELQAYVEVKQPWRDPSSGYVQEITTKEFSREKFAELIVKECMSVCKSRVGNSDYNTGRMWCASDIKKHFGVES
jgi:hypothetical protein